MKKALHYLCFLALLSWNAPTFAQSLKLEVPIMFTDSITDEGVRFAASTDDAEQENNEIDNLFDDDLDAGWEGEPQDQNILSTGLRFRNIFIPRGARIDSAFLILTSHEGKSPEDVANITILGDNVDNSPTFTEDSLISARNRTVASVRWIVDEEWELWGVYQTPDLKAIVQEIINRQGWQAGNALTFMLLGENQGPSDLENAREFESFENIADPEDGGDGQNHPERVPRLVIYYTVNNAKFEVPVMVTDTITDEDGITFAASSDDAEQENNEIDNLYDDDLDAGWEGEPQDQNILSTGIRFRNVFIPKGAVIDSAFIVLTSHEGKSTEDVANLTIIGDDVDNSPTFTEDSLVSARNRTSASVRWIVDEEWGLWTEHQTPDLKTIVQEIIEREGWQTGNALTFMLLGENQGPSDVENAREFESFENIADPEDGGDGQNHPERVPRLVVYYSSPSGTTSAKSIFTSNVKSLKVYPNPTNIGIVKLELESDAASVIRLYNVNGQLLKLQRNDFGKDIQFNTGNLPTGTYFIQATQGNEQYIQKLMIEK